MQHATASCKDAFVATLSSFLQGYTGGSTQQLLGTEPAILTPSSDNLPFLRCYNCVISASPGVHQPQQQVGYSVCAHTCKLSHC